MTNNGKNLEVKQ